MRVFRELTVRGAPGALTAYVAQLDHWAAQADGWTRDLEREQGLAAMGGSGSPLHLMICYTCSARAHRAAAHLWISDRNGDSLYVPNIVPIELHELGHEAYNTVLVDFAEHVALPAGDGLAVRVDISTDVASLRSWLSDTSASRLEAFSALANKATGTAHPLDQARWFAFVIAAHLAHETFPPDVLARWLAEEGGWSDERVWELASSYESDRALLAAYDRRPRAADGHGDVS